MSTIQKQPFGSFRTLQWQNGNFDFIPVSIYICIVGAAKFNASILCSALSLKIKKEQMIVLTGQCHIFQKCDYQRKAKYLPKEQSMFLQV